MEKAPLNTGLFLFKYSGMVHGEWWVVGEEVMAIRYQENAKFFAL
jgi:hypothetical protein